MRIYLFPLIFLLAAGVTGCKVSSTDTVTTHISTDTSNGSIAVHAAGRPEADITAAGDLSVAGSRVAVTAEQRELLQKYYVITLMMRDHDIATGNPDIAAHAEWICTSFAQLRSTQEKQLVSQIPAFAPYALINSHEADDCRLHVKNRV